MATATNNMQSKNDRTNIDFDKQEIALNERARKVRQTSREKLGVIAQVVNIYSDGTRMSGTVWKPLDCETHPEKKYPAILLCHGWGGKRPHLDYSYAPTFCKAGYIVLTFSYRGWDDSDGVLVKVETLSSANTDGVSTMKVREIRKVIDPEWQMRDVLSSFEFLLGMPEVDSNRVGIWGSSFGGGHALATAARDKRVKCIVTQIASIDTYSNWVNRHPDFKGEDQIHKLSWKHASGDLMPWNVSKPIGLDGMPNLPKVVFEHTRNTFGSLHDIQVPVLLLAANNEELFHNHKNSDLVYEKLKGRVPTELKYLPGTHYDAYGDEAYKIGVNEALRWFNTYLGAQEKKTDNASNSYTSVSSKL